MMDKIKSITISNPVAISENMVFFPANLQHGIVYHNEHGLVAVTINHTKKVNIHSGLSMMDGTMVRYSLEVALKGTSHDVIGYESVRIDLMEAKNHVSLNASIIPESLC